MGPGTDFPAPGRVVRPGDPPGLLFEPFWSFPDAPKPLVLLISEFSFWLQAYIYFVDFYSLPKEQVSKNKEQGSRRGTVAGMARRATG